VASDTRFHFRFRFRAIGRSDVRASIAPIFKGLEKPKGSQTREYIQTGRSWTVYRGRIRARHSRASFHAEMEIVCPAAALLTAKDSSNRVRGSRSRVVRTSDGTGCAYVSAASAAPSTPDVKGEVTSAEPCHVFFFWRASRAMLVAA
jgi:hypothetical protein